MGRERRSDLRFACDVETIVELADGSRHEARALDVSYSGICVTTEEPIRMGTEAIFHLRLLFDWAESDSLAVPGRIVWSTPVEGRHQLGARFDKNMDSRSWTRLDVLLQFLSGTLDLAPPP